MSPLAPTKRWIVGFELEACWSMFFEVRPISSASIIANMDHFTMSNQRSSPWRTAGPSGSLDGRCNQTYNKISYRVERLFSKRQEISAKENVELKELFCTVGGNVNWYSH